MSAPQQLARVVGLPGAIWIGLGSIVGTGAFVSLGLGAALAGPALPVVLIIAAGIATANGLSSARLAAAHPVSGGTYAYARRFVHPLAGFAAGWMFLAAKSASAAAAARGLAGYLGARFGVGESSVFEAAAAAGAVLIVTALVAGGLQRSSRVNIALVVVTVGSLLLFSAHAASWAGWAAVVSSLGAAFTALPTRPVADLLQATAILFVAYTGYGRIATLGEEVREPARTIPRAILATLAIALLLYLAVAVSAAAAVGDAGLATASRDGALLERIARETEAPGLAWLVSLGAAAAMAGVLLNLLLGLSRVLLAMAREGEMPAPLVAVDATSGSPARAVWVAGGVVAILALTLDVAASWTFSAFTVLLYYGLTHLAALRLPSATRGDRFLAGLGLAACIGLACFVPTMVWAAGIGLLGAGFGLRAVLLRGAER